MISGGGLRVNSVARAGGAGVCAIYSIGAGCMFILPGFIMTIIAYGDSTWEDSFFNSMRVIAIILLVTGLVLLAVGIGLCMYVKKTMSTETQGTVVLQPQGPTVTGYNPGVGPQGYPLGGQQPPNFNTTQQYQQPQGQYPSQYPPAGQQYPPAGQQYPPAGQQYPPPGQQYPPPGQQYPPSNSYAPPAYAPGEGSAPSAPPAYNTLMDSKPPH